MIEVLAPGMLDLVMDLGRPGYRDQGVPAGGAADAPALIAANRMVGNADSAAGLELLLQGPRLRFARSCSVALAGAAAGPAINGIKVNADFPVAIRQGDVLDVGRLIGGARTYLGVSGGIEVEQVLGSRSTFLPGGFGGHLGRALRAGDALCLGARSSAPVQGKPSAPATAAGRLRILPGPQLAGFDDLSVNRLASGDFRATADCGRGGIRLKGPGLRYAGLEMRSQGVLPGAIQVPPDGQPILLGWDGPVTGGYPVIAGIIAADLRRLAQLRPGDEVGFSFVTREEALAIWQREMSWLR